MVLTWLKFQNVNWFIRNTDFPVNSFWKISSVYRPKTPPTTPRSLFWHINCDVPKWKIINMLLDGKWMINRYSWIERKCQYWCEINLYWLATSAVHQFYNSLVLSSLHQKFIISLSVHQFIRSSVHQFTSWSLHHQFINSSFQQFSSSAVQQQFIRSSPISSLIHQLIIS